MSPVGCAEGFSGISGCKMGAKTLSLFLLALFSLVAAGCGISLAADVTPPPEYRNPTEVSLSLLEAGESGSVALFPLVLPDAAKGAALFAGYCAPCHGEAGLGDGPRASRLSSRIPPIGDVEVMRSSSPARWFAIVSQGVPERFMPPFQEQLTDRQRWDVVAYAIHLSFTSESLSEGENLYRIHCAGCHGEAGKGDGNQAVKPMPDFTNLEVMVQRSGKDFYQAITFGFAPAMPAYEATLTARERWMLSDYLRTFQFVRSPLSASSEPTRFPEEGQPAPLSETPAGLESSEGTAMEKAADETQTLGTVSGSLFNASGGQVPVGLTVTLHGIEDMRVVITATTTTKQDRSYLFPEVEFKPERHFLTTVDFQGVTYGSDFVNAEQGDSNLDLPITIYETTTDVSGLIVERLHYFFELLDQQTLQVVELYVISNPGNRSVVSLVEGQPVLTFSLPEGATSLEFQDGVLGDRFVPTENGFGDRLPVRPSLGEHQVMFSYQIPFPDGWGGRKLDLVRPAILETKAVVILVPENVVNVTSEEIRDQGTREVEGVHYRLYQGGALESGEQLHLSLTASPLNRLSLSTDNVNELLIGFGAFSFSLAGVWLWFYRRRRPGETQPSAPGVDMLTEWESPEGVMDAILALDDLYQEGQLPEQAYRLRRSELKARLRELVESK